MGYTTPILRVGQTIDYQWVVYHWYVGPTIKIVKYCKSKKSAKKYVRKQKRKQNEQN